MREKDPECYLKEVLLAGQVQQGPVTVQLSLLKVLDSNNLKPLQLANKAQGVL